MPENNVTKTINFTRAVYAVYENGNMRGSAAEFPKKLSKPATIRELKKLAGDSLIQQSVEIQHIQKTFSAPLADFLKIASEDVAAPVEPAAPAVNG